MHLENLTVKFIEKLIDEGYVDFVQQEVSTFLSAWLDSDECGSQEELELQFPLLCVIREQTKDKED